MPEATAAASSEGEAEKPAATEEDVPAAKSIPAGIVPLFFSGASQQIFECVVDTDLTTENPCKLVPKQKIVDDFKNRAAVCDFHPVKQKMLNYPGEEILLVYDYDFKYGENFYVCVTEDAKELVLNPPAEEVDGGEGEAGKKEEEEEDQIPKTPEPREWECLNSDLEIREEFVELTRPLLQFKVSRKRCNFGSPYIFTDYNASTHPTSCADITAQEDPNFDLQRSEMEIGIQAVSDKSDSFCQTELRVPKNAAVQYSPQTLSVADMESAWEEEGMKEFLRRVCPRLELCLQQNEIMDFFPDDYIALSDSDVITGNKSDTNMKEYQSFTDLKFSKDKIVTAIDWHPTIKGIIAVACGENYSIEERIDLSSRLLKKPSLILIWSFTDPIHPQLFLEAPEDIVCFQFNSSDPNVIVGGCINGQIVLWDIHEYQDKLQLNRSTDGSDVTRGAAATLAIFDTDPKLDHAPIVQYCACSSIKDGHTMRVADVQWIPSHIEVCQKTAQVLENPSQVCSQIISCGVDGVVAMWDVRAPPQRVTTQQQKTSLNNSNQPFAYLDLVWKPFLWIPLPRIDFPGEFSTTRVSIREKRKERTKTAGSGTGADVEGGLAVVNEGTTKPHPQVGEGVAGEGKPIEGACTKFFVGTQDGEVVYCDWVPVKDNESGKLVASRPEYYFNVHNGPVSCVNRSPFFRDIVLTVGGWTFAIWKEGAKSDALLKSCSSTIPLTGGAWSPTRPGIFFVTKQNGNVDVWDLMDRSHEPLLTQNVSTMSITSVYPWQLTSKQLMLAVGDSGGTLHILEVPWSLSAPSSNEVTIMQAFFEREAQRLEFTTQRMNTRALEKKTLDAAKMEQTSEEEKITAAVPTESTSWEDQAKREYDDYLTMEVQLLIQLGVIKSETDPDDI